MDYRIPVLFSVIAIILVIASIVSVVQGNYAMWIAYLSLSGILALTGQVDIIRQKIDRLNADTSKCQCSDKKDPEA